MERYPVYALFRQLHGVKTDAVDLVALLLHGDVEPILLLHGIAAASVGEDWRPLCGLDACARATEQLLSGKVVSRGRAARAFDRLLEDAVKGGVSELVSETLWTARPAAEPGKDGQAMLLLRGALALRVSGLAEDKSAEALPPELAAVRADDQPGPARKLVEFLRADGLLRFVPIVAGLALAGAGTVVESLLFRSAIDIGQRLALFEQRLAAAGALLVFLVALFFVEWPLARALRKPRPVART